MTLFFAVLSGLLAAMVVLAIRGWHRALRGWGQALQDFHVANINHAEILKALHVEIEEEEILPGDEWKYDG